MTPVSNWSATPTTRFEVVAFEGFPWIGLYPPVITFVEAPAAISWTVGCSTYTAGDGWFDGSDLVVGPTIEGPVPARPADPAEPCLESTEYALRLGDRIRFGDGGTRLELHRDDGRDGPFELQRLDLAPADPAVVVGSWRNGLLPVEIRADGTVGVAGCLDGTWTEGVMRLPRSLTDCWSPTTIGDLPPGLPGEEYRILASGVNDVVYLTSYSTSLRLVRAG